VVVISLLRLAKRLKFA